MIVTREEKMGRKKTRADEDELGVRHANRGCMQDGKEVGARHVVDEYKDTHAHGKKC